MKQVVAIVALTSVLTAALGACGQKSANESNTNHANDPSENTLMEKPASAKLQARTGQPGEKPSQAQQVFHQLSEQMVERMWQLYPSWAVREGYYAVADQLERPDANYRKKLLVFAREYQKKFSAFDTKELTAAERSDLALVQNFLSEIEWNITEFKPHEWNPAAYNVSHGFALILNTEYAPLEQRLRTFSKRLRLVPAYYRAAEESIKQPAAPQLVLGIQQNEGAMSVFAEDLEQKLADSTLSDSEKKTFKNHLTAARNAIQEYITFLQTKHAELEKSDKFKDFRIGQDLYEKKFKYDIQISMSGKELYERALQEKAILHKKMAELSDKLWPKYFPDQQPPADNLKKISAVLEKLSEHHATKETFQAAVEKQIPELVEFVTEKNLLTLDPEKPLIVRTTPPYMRGYSVASINAPGPYDSGANTYYNVMPIAEYKDDRAESLLKEYNSYLMQILNIHEAIPGHYTQLVYANKSPSLIKNILGNGAMIEGWAVYAERMMLEAGYGDFSPELWLMYYKWNLRTVANTILDYGIQVNDMQQQQALDLMINEAFQQEAEALGKWRRATLSQVQLTSYFAGFADILALRDELKQKMGDDFDLKAFHEKFLSYGNAPVPVIRKLMLGELGGGQP